MKKIVLIVLLFIGASSHSFSQNEVNDQLLSKLSSYNENSTGKILIGEAERRWWQTLLNITTIVAADAGGVYAGVVGSSHVIGAVGLATSGVGAAIVGGIAGAVGGAGASNAAWHGLHRQSPAVLNYGNLEISIPSEFANFANVGIHHNYVLHNFYTNSGNITDFYRTVLDGEQILLMESQPMVELKNSIAQSAENSTVDGGIDFDNFSNDLVRKGLMTIMGQQTLNLFFEKYKRCNSPESMKGLINYYITEISDSKVSLVEKRALISAFLTASESPFYWAPR